MLPFAMHGLRYPLGPDGPVYLWWTRLAGPDGLSAVPRPGVPAVALALAGALHLPLTATIAGLEISLSVALGLACWSFARAGGAGRWTAFAAGLLAGTFAVHLAAGYLATLAFAAAFVGGLVALTRTDRRATVGAAGLFAAATFSHPLFAPLGLAILGVAVVLGWRTARGEAERIGLALAGAGGVVVLGLLALQLGPSPLRVDTSRDGFLRRAGLGDVLRGAYLDRFVHRWTRYVEWVSIPLAVLGWRDPDGFVRRVLWAWAIVTVAGIALSLVTGWLPADRFITFGFAIPILAAFGLARVVRWLEPRRALALASVVALVGVMLAGAWIAWARQEPFMSDREVEQVTAANGVAAAAPSGTPLVFFVNEADETVSFLATRAGNVIRAAVPPDRIRDVVVVVPPIEDHGSQERTALSTVTMRDLREAPHPPTGDYRFATTAFDPVDTGSRGFGDWTMVAPGVAFSADTPPGTIARTPVDPLEPADTWQISVASLLQLALFGLGGYGWARAASFEPGLEAAAVAPAFGFGALVLLAIALERLGVPLTGSIGPLVVSAIAAGGGFALLALLERRGGSRAPDQIDEEPPE